jgi:predicted nicotinamide N-methyase
MELDSLLARIGERHETETCETSLRGLTLRLLQIKDMAAYIEEVVERAPEGRVRLPYWAKVWEASLVLADFLLSLPQFAPGSSPQNVIELGAGLGVPGLFLAAAGHHVTLTDYEPEALEFARATALLNGLGERVRVQGLEWARPDLPERFDAVIGSELFYNPSDCPHLLGLLGELRKEGAPAYLAKGPAVQAAQFLACLRDEFEVAEVRRRLRSPEGTQVVSIYVVGRALSGPPEGA